MSDILFSNTQIGNITLPNRIVMAPMTRSRAIDNVPNQMMAQYYAARADAGLLITEGVAPSPNGLGYVRTPGIYSQAQIDGWRLVTDAVHDKGGRVFIQLMHVGRVGHPDNMPEGAELLAPSAITSVGKMYTDTRGPQDQPEPRAMTAQEIEQTIEEYVQAAKNAVAAGFDGIELHGANGYLIDQFLHPVSNQRDDDFGGTPDNRNRFAIEVARRTADAIGADKVGIRLSPLGVFGNMIPFDGIEDQFTTLAGALGALNLAYLHVVDHSSMGTPEVPWALKQALRSAFDGPFILSGGYDGERATAELTEDRGELVAFGRPFISNADLVTRLQQNAALNEPDFDTFYTPGAEGYLDYPLLEQ